MKPRNPQSSPSRLKKARQPLLSSVAMGALLLSVPVAAMLLVEPDPPAPPPPEPVETEAAEPETVEVAERPDIPPAYVVTEWERLLDVGSEPSLRAYTEFLRHYSNFPNTIEMRQQAELSMSLDTPAAERLRFFEVSDPVLARGHFLFADALLQTGNEAEAAAQAREAWRSGALGGEERAALLERFGRMLTPSDHAERVERQLWNDDISGAAAMLSLLTPDDRALASARIALKRGSERGGDTDAARNMLENVPANLRRHPGLIADQYTFARANKNSVWARELLAETTIAPGSAGDKDKWMQIHLQAARAAVNDRQYDLAYRIASHHGGLSFSTPLIDNSAGERDTFTSLEWLAGWIALHHLDQPGEAIQHFVNFKDAAQFAPTISRGLFWAARSAEAAGSPLARQYYAEAAEYPTTFHGQLAHEKIGRDLVIEGGDRPGITDGVRTAFNADPRVEAVRVYGRQGDEGKQRMFLQALARDADRPTLALVSDLANATGFERVAVLSTRGNNTKGPDAIIDISYPKLDVPAETRARWVLNHAIMRQESQFESDAVSGAGARGLMQLMPATAREQARRLGVSYNHGNLTGDPNYNIRLGSDYFLDMVNYWDGSVVLAIASYNAGPGNVRRWLERNGDPRSPSVDVVRWIEEIPFDETRGYVRNVLSNIIVYEELAPQHVNGGPQTARLSWYLDRGTRG